MPNDHLILRYFDPHSTSVLHELFDAGWHGIIEFCHPSDEQVSSAVAAPILITEEGRYRGYEEIRDFAQSLTSQRMVSSRE